MLEHRFRALGPNAQDELQCHAASVLRVIPADGWREKRRQDLTQRRGATMARLSFVQHARSLAVELCGARAEDLEEQLVLGPEVIVDRRNVHASFGSDVPDRYAMEPVARKELLGRGKDLAPRRRGC